jgi:hypothetical protein
MTVDLQAVKIPGEYKSKEKKRENANEKKRNENEKKKDENET